MKIIGERSLSSMVKYLLELIFLGGAGILISLPLSLKWYLSTTFGATSIELYRFLLGLLYVTGILALLIVYEIRRIFKTLKSNDPFVLSNVNSLKNMGIYSFLIAFCYMFKIILFNSVATLVIFMIFVIAGFFTIILAEVFKQAIDAKQENDLTV